MTGHVTQANFFETDTNYNHNSNCNFAQMLVIMIVIVIMIMIMIIHRTGTEEGEARKMGIWKGSKISRFFPTPATILFLSSFSTGSSR